MDIGVRGYFHDNVDPSDQTGYVSMVDVFHILLYLFNCILRWISSGLNFSLGPHCGPGHDLVSVSVLGTTTLVKHPRAPPHQLRLLAHSHLTEVDGEDGVRSGALSVHLGAGRGPRQSAELQALQQLHIKKKKSEEKNIIIVDMTSIFC